MQIISHNIEARLVEIIKPLKGDIGGHYAMHFHLSKLQEASQGEFQQKIAVNVLNDIFRKVDGAILSARDGDIFVVYHGEDKRLLDNAIFQLRYLFMDDPLATHKDGRENDDFCTLYVLAFQWRAFYRLCTERLSFIKQSNIAAKEARLTTSTVQDRQINPMRLADIASEVSEVDLEYALRRQPICAIAKGDTRNVREVYNEIYVNITHFQKLLTQECDVMTDRWLFGYLTELLDYRVLDIVPRQSKLYLQKPVSLNLNVQTLLTREFSDFCNIVQKRFKVSVVVELQAHDIFLDMARFIAGRERVKELGGKMCLDGLTAETIGQIDREHFGFDLVKMQWNADMPSDLESTENQRLKREIAKCGANRVILCRCDSHHAIEYGNVLGITLFQGRYPDQLVDPDSVIIN